MLRLSVTTEGEIGAVRAVVSELQLPGSAVAIEATPRITPATDSLTGIVRPTLGGLRIGLTYALCTLGFKAKKTGATRYFVINAHCTQTIGAVNGDTVGQTGLPTSPIGVEVADPALTVQSGCPFGYVCRWSDAALIQYDSAAVGTLYTIGQPINQSGSRVLTSSPFYVVGEMANSALLSGTVLSKVGATTGWTSGTVGNTCFDYYSFGSAQGIARCQYSVGAYGAGGDSGSPVFSYDALTGKAWLAGVLWGVTGNSFSFSPLDGIKTDLGAMTVYSAIF